MYARSTGCTNTTTDVVGHGRRMCLGQRRVGMGYINARLNKQGQRGVGREDARHDGLIGRRDMYVWKECGVQPWATPGRHGLNQRAVEQSTATRRGHTKDTGRGTDRTEMHGCLQGVLVH